MDPPKFYLDRPCTFYALWASHFIKGILAILWVVCPQGGKPAAIFYPFGHPAPYAYMHFFGSF
jgi:hypothetical protein